MHNAAQARAISQGGRYVSKPAQLKKNVLGKDARVPASDRMLAFLFLIPWALDYRPRQADGSLGGNLLQITLLVISTCSATVLVARNKSRYRYDKSWSALVKLWGIYIVFSFVASPIQGVPFGHFVRIVLPFVLCMIGIFVGGVLATKPDNLNGLLIWIVVTAAISTAWNAIYAFTGMGLSISDVRYNILGPLIVFLLAIPASMLLYGKPRYAPYAVVALVIGGVALILSQTRTQLVVAAAIAVSLFFYARKHKHIVPRVASKAKSVEISLVSRVLVMIALLAVSVAIALVVEPNILDRFAGRVSMVQSEGGDPTALTRIAEAAGEIESMRSGMAHMLFGVGIGSDHYWDLSYIVGIPADSKEAGVTEAIWDPGHIGWLYQFYASGLLFGWVLPVLFLVTIRNGWRSSNPLFGASVVCSFVAYMFEGFLSHPMGFRAGGVVCGIFIGAAAIGASSNRNKTRKPQIKAAA